MKAPPFSSLHYLTWKLGNQFIHKYRGGWLFPFVWLWLPLPCRSLRSIIDRSEVRLRSIESSPLQIFIAKRIQKMPGLAFSWNPAHTVCKHYPKVDTRKDKGTSMGFLDIFGISYTNYQDRRLGDHKGDCQRGCPHSLRCISLPSSNSQSLPLSATRRWVTWTC